MKMVSGGENSRKESGKNQTGEKRIHREWNDQPTRGGSEHAGATGRTINGRQKRNVSERLLSPVENRSIRNRIRGRGKVGRRL